MLSCVLVVIPVALFPQDLDAAPRVAVLPFIDIHYAALAVMPTSLLTLEHIDRSDDNGQQRLNGTRVQKRLPSVIMGANHNATAQLMG